MKKTMLLASVSLVVLLGVGAILLYFMGGKVWVKGRLQAVDAVGTWVGPEGRVVVVSTEGEDLVVKGGSREMRFGADRGAEGFIEKPPASQANVTIEEHHCLELKPDGTLQIRLARSDGQSAEVYRRKK